METVLPAVADVFRAMDQISEDVRKTTGIKYRSGADKGQCVLTNNRVSVHAGWRQVYINVVIENAHIIVTEFNSQFALPGERLMYFRDPPQLGRHRFRPELSIARELRWVDEDKPQELLSSHDLADRCVRMFLDLVARANRGEIDRSDDF
jgi:hypothetical protein